MNHTDRLQAAECLIKVAARGDQLLQLLADRPQLARQFGRLSGTMFEGDQLNKYPAPMLERMLRSREKLPSGKPLYKDFVSRASNFLRQNRPAGAGFKAPFPGSGGAPLPESLDSLPNFREPRYSPPFNRE